MNPSEAFVYMVCRKSFLSLWSYANPQGKNGKELCDILIVCDPDVIIFSVKDVHLSGSGDDPVALERWIRKAVEESLSQVYGAERWIKSAKHVIRQDGTQGIPFPLERRIHRVAVALGGEGKVWMASGDFGKGYAHVFDEVSFATILRELDTVTDFVNYLHAKEKLALQGTSVLCYGEEDLLAFYLQQDRKFPEERGHVIVDAGMWKEFQKNKQYRAKKEADKVSYAWDNLIELFCADALHGRLEFGGKFTESEQAIRVIAREDRFSRRVLGKDFIQFIEICLDKKKVGSRKVPSGSGVLYVFLILPHNIERKLRMVDLVQRCFVARSLCQNSEIVGIATEKPERGKECSFDLYYLNIPAWKSQHQVILEKIQEKRKYFGKSVYTRVREIEYPTSSFFLSRTLHQFFKDLVKFAKKGTKYLKNGS